MDKINSIVFLDVDGVLNDPETPNITPEGFPGVEDKYLHLLYVICSLSGAQVVLVTDWKDEWDVDPGKCKEDGVYLINRLKEHQVIIIDKTDDISRGDDVKSGRGYGIKKYLEDHLVDKYVILDDYLFSDYDSVLQHHLVLVNKGLTEEDVEKALAIL